MDYTLMTHILDPMDYTLITPISAPDESRRGFSKSLKRLRDVAESSHSPTSPDPSSPEIEGLIVAPIGRRLLYRHRLKEFESITVTLGPALCTALGVWLGSRNGRKVRIKIGDIEAEAQTQEQVEELIARAQQIQQEIQ